MISIVILLCHTPGMNNHLLIAFAITIILLPLSPALATLHPALTHIFTWSSLLLIAFEVFFLIQLLFRKEQLKNSYIIQACLALTLIPVVAAATGLYGTNLKEILRWLSIIWLIPIVDLIFNKYGTARVTRVLLLILLFQALWGIAQFSLQHDLGLRVIGESRLAPYLSGVAKFTMDGTKLIRAYGPYPHPNSFAAALVCGIGMLLLNIFKSKQKISFEIVATSFFIFVALLLSLSRSGYLATFFITVVTLFRTSQKKLQLARKNARTLLVVFFILTVFLPLFIARESDPEDRAAADRQEGLRWASDLIQKQVVWQGTGPGNYRLALADYLRERKQMVAGWQIAPVHSALVLLVAELGKILFLILALVAVFTFRKNATAQKLALPLLALSPLWLFDHYLVTQSAPLVWVILYCLLWLRQAPPTPVSAAAVAEKS